MTTLSALELQAVQAAKTQNWQAAIEANSAILDQSPQDIGALIRTGVAYAQLGKKTQAKDAFTHVLEIDKSNQLAKKHLLKLKNHQNIILSSLPADEQFIEEPGKTKTVELHRLAGKEVLETLSIGQMCELKSKNRYISVETGKTYIGSLPEDLSSRLAKLMKGGNQYTGYIRAVSSGSCSVFIKETFRSKEHEYVNSFPSMKNQMATINDMFLVDENIPIQMEDIPPQIVITDADEEKTLDSFHIDDTIEEVPPHEEIED
jgi:tetratricopeptide (TPR) repeat protein